jgi:hypothetical protein
VAYEEFREDVVVMMMFQKGGIIIFPEITDGRAKFQFSKYQWPSAWKPALLRFIRTWTALGIINELSSCFNNEGESAVVRQLHEYWEMAEYALSLCGEGEEE